MRRTARRLRFDVLEDRVTPVGGFSLYMVNSTADTGTAGDTVLTLREALEIQRGDITPSAAQQALITHPTGLPQDTIVFDPTAVGGRTITFTNNDTSALNLFGPTGFVVTTTLTIDGSAGGAGVTLSGGGTERLFAVSGAATLPTPGNLTLENLTLENGLAQGGAGGGPGNAAPDLGGGGGGAAGLGGAVFNQGTLTILGSTLTGNQAVGGSANGTTGTSTLSGGGGLGGPGDSSGKGGPPNGGAAGLTGNQSGGFGGGGGVGGMGATGAPLDGGAGGFGGGGGAGGNPSGGNGGAGGFGGGGGGGGSVNSFGGVGGFGGGAGGANGAQYNLGGGPGGGGGGMGGAVFNYLGATLTITNSTIAANTAAGGAAPFAGGGSGYGGGVFNYLGTANLFDDTFANNTVTAGTGAAAGAAEGQAVYNLSRDVGNNPTATLTAANSIFAKQAGNSDVVNDQEGGTATLNATGPNLATTAVVNTGLGGRGGTVTGTAFTVGTPLLGALANNGGPTQTMLPQAGSPALGTGSNAAVPTGATTDQRGTGFARVANTTVDLGAVEVQSAPAPITVTPANSVLTAGTAGTTYSQTFGATGGTGSYTFSVPQGANLDGLTLNRTTGVLSGTPTAAGQFSFTVTATDTAQATGSKTYSLTVSPAVAGTTPPAVTSGGTAAFRVGQSGTFTVTTTPGTPAGVTLAETGLLPAGLTFHDNGDGTATLSGTPAAGGEFPVTVEAANGDGSQSARQTLTVAVALANGTGVSAAPAAATVTVTPLSASVPPIPAQFTRYAPTNVITAAGGGTGGTVTITFIAPAGQPYPANLVYLKYGRNPADNTVEWYQYPGFRLTSTTTATLTLTDGGTGDDDQVANDTILDPGVPATPTATAPVVVSGRTDGTALVYAPATGGQLGTAPTATVSPFGSLGANVRTATADVDGDGTPDLILVTGPGVAPTRFAVLSGKDNTTVLIPPTDPFGNATFSGGGFVAGGDFNLDGRAEVVITPDQGGGPNVVIYDLVGTTPTVVKSFLGLNDPAFRGGARAAVGDFNADGTPDLVVAAGFLGGPRVSLYNGTTVLGATPTNLVNDFFAFDGTDASTLRNGVFVAAGDVNGDGLADLIVGGGPGGSPRVLILDGKTLIGQGGVTAVQATPVANFFVAGNDADRGGVRLAAKDLDGDGKADVVAGSGEGSATKVRVYLGKNFSGTGEPATFQNLDPFGTTLPGGVFVG